MFFIYAFWCQRRELTSRNKKIKYEMKITNLICHDFITQQILSKNMKKNMKN